MAFKNKNSGINKFEKNRMTHYTFSELNISDGGLHDDTAVFALFNYRFANYF